MSRDREGNYRDRGGMGKGTRDETAKICYTLVSLSQKE